MTWILRLGRCAATAAIVESLCGVDERLRLVRTPTSGDSTGVVVCTADCPDLPSLLAKTSAEVLVVAPADDHPDPWAVLAAGANDVVLWDGDPTPVRARLARLHEVDKILAEPEVSGVLLGSSQALRCALRDLVTAARFGTGPMLILGETGTGKELAARVAHAVSDGGQLVVVDCTTIVPTLSGSELFGHERGAFTGAQTVRTGACAAANGGTLLLDEVGELPIDLQPELLRVIQEGMFKRVGSDRWQRTDFRLICATNRDLEAEVAAGRFRSDLYYRIAASMIRLPPLRERPEDIVPLFLAFLAQANRTLAGIELTPAVAATIQSRGYPGNLRDLRQFAHRVAARHVGPGPITPGDLAPADRPNGQQPVDGSLTESVREWLRNGITLKELREQVADIAVEIAMREAGGNVRAAAARLGVTDRALHLRRAQRREASSEASSA